MKKVAITVLLFICLAAKASFAIPSAPELSLTTTGVNVSVSWTAVPGATGYQLFYAPFPYTGPETIGSIDMGTQTSLSVDLWSGAAYYVAVQAYDQTGSSGYSNIEALFTRAVTYDDALSATAKGTYSQSGNTLTSYFTTSNWPDGEGPPVNVPFGIQLVTLTETTLEFMDEENELQTWHRAQGQAGNIVGTWTRFEDNQTRLVLDIRSNRTITLTGHAGIFSVPYGTMTIDGNYSDWTTGYRVYADVDGPDCGNTPGLDLTEVYLAQDETFIYVRFVLNGALDPTYAYKFGNGDVHIHLTWNGSSGSMDYSGLAQRHFPSSFFHIDGNQFECKFNKSDVIAYWGGINDLNAWLDQGVVTVCRDYVEMPILQFWF